MIDFLAETKKLTKHQAYQLVSIAGNVAITQLVDKPNLGVHVRLPKSIFTTRSGRPQRPSRYRNLPRWDFKKYEILGGLRELCVNVRRLVESSA